MTPARIRTQRILRLLLGAIAAFRRDRMQVHAAALAFRLLLSMFPFFIVVLALIGALDRPDFFNWLGDQARLFLPTPARALIGQVIGELRGPRTGILSSSAAVALWLASGAMRALMDTFNLVFGAPESRPLWKRYPLSILFTVALALMLVVAALLVAVGPRAMLWLGQQLGIKSVFVTLWSALRLPLALLLLTATVASAYHWLPNVEQRFRLLSAGAALAVLVWLGGSLAFGYYVEHFSRYGIMYGSIWAVIVLLIYLFLSTAALLFGAELNAVIREYDAARRSDRIARRRLPLAVRHRRSDTVDTTANAVRTEP